MCNCTKGAAKVSVNSKGCGGKVSDLHIIRNRLITLSTLTSTQEKKDEYKDYRTQVEQLLKDSVETCPDLQTITMLKEYVNNEYASYNN